MFKIFRLHSNKKKTHRFNTCNTKSSVLFHLFVYLFFLSVAIFSQCFFFCLFAGILLSLSYSTKHRQRHDKTMTTAQGLFHLLTYYFCGCFFFQCVFVFVCVVKRNDGLNHHNWLHCICFF